MSYSLGLTLYNLAGRPGQVASTALPERPGGRLVWLHAPGPEALAAMRELARQLREADGVNVVLTTDHATNTGDLLSQPAPADHPRAAQDFLNHWRPELAVFCDGALFPAMIHECTLRRLPLLMVNGRQPGLLPGREGWYPGLIKAALQTFDHILVLDDTAHRAFQKAGAEPAQITITGRMEEASAALPCVESDRAALAAMMATRPIWVAADVAPQEVDHVIAAHREALQLAHRLLMIFVPQDAASAEAIVARMESEQNWRVALRRTEQDPETETEVYVVDASEYGLWYRLAPVTFMGGSLEGDGCSRNPMEPAALGSAILYGPRPGIYGQAFGRLGSARAARIVTSGGDLAEALGDLLSPDRAARQARAAWTVASEGVEGTEQAMTLIRRLMDGPD